LNVFKIATAATNKGEQTRREIYESALLLFRQKGFDDTSMREIAAQAGVALGAAYYYFPSKEAIIQAYYEAVQAEHNRLVAEAFANPKLTLKQRLQMVFHSKLDILQPDRKLLGVIFRYSGEPDHPLSCLGKATERTRRESMHVFNQAVANERLPADLQELLPIALWALHMGVLILFIYDNSPQQRRTRTLVDGALELTVRSLVLARNPLLKAMRSKMLELLRTAELLPVFELGATAGGHKWPSR
jgi:AcrR family transcriptional regulator